MKLMHKAKRLALPATLFTILSLMADALAQGTAFTYQGRLDESGAPATGLYDFRAQVYNRAVAAEPGDALMSPTLTLTGVPVTNGLFVLNLDFGAAPFNGEARWLALAVRTNNALNYTLLAPRQALTATPYAILASNVSGMVTAAHIDDAIARDDEIFLTVIANGGVGSGLDADRLDGLSSEDFWRLGGNGGTTPGTHFVGTADNQPLELKVNNARALRLEPAAASPNLIGGHPQNLVSSGLWGATISGGGGAGSAQNTVGGHYGTIGGGAFNKVLRAYGVVGGGAENVANGPLASISGGTLNEAGEEATVGGGYQNRANALQAAIGGGLWNFASGDRSFVGGGQDNRAGSNYSAVVGGQLNQAQGQWSAVGGGQNNTTQPDSPHATIAGGFSNLVWGSFSTVAGGQQNRAGLWTPAAHVSIGGGQGNSVEGGSGGVIGGGLANSLDEDSHYSVVSGGQDNRIEETQIFASHFGGHSTIGGGNYNRIFGQFATIGGGATNKAYGIMTAAGTVGGGVNNEAWFGDTVSGGGNNIASGGGATVPGGYENQATGSRSFAAGYQARASHARSFVWSSRDNPAPSFATNRFHVHASEGFSVDYAGQRGDGGGQRWVVLGGYSDFPGQTISTWNGARLTDGGVWTDNSDRNAKENFAAVSGREILEKVAALPVRTWNYKTEGPDVRHIGPVAQDFYAAFRTGADDRHLAALDSAGVALAAIQGLNQKLEAENAALKQELTELRKLVHQLNARINGGGR